MTDNEFTIFETEYIDEFIEKNKREFINNVLELIDNSDWTLRKKAEYRVIIELLYDNIINNGFNDFNYKFINDVYNTLSI